MVPAILPFEGVSFEGRTMTVMNPEKWFVDNVIRPIRNTDADCATVSHLEQFLGICQEVLRTAGRMLWAFKLLSIRYLLVTIQSVSIALSHTRTSGSFVAPITGEANAH